MRKLLVGAALVVVAAIVVLVLRRSGSESAAEEPASAGSSGSVTGASSDSARRGERPTLAPGSANAPGSDGSDAVPGTIVQHVGSDGTVTISDVPRSSGEPTESANEYTVGGVNVRDHRGSGVKPIDVPPSVHAPGAPQIQSSVTAEIGQKVRAVIYACAREASREGRGPSPHIDGQFVSNIRGGELTIISAIVQPRDLGEAATVQVKSCVETKVVGLTSPAQNQPDLDNYGINLRLRLP